MLFMKRVCFYEYGGPEVLRIENIEKPEIKKEGIKIDVKAIGVNPVDTYFREGTYKPPMLPWTPGSDFSGVVVEIGSSDSDLEIGDRVFGTGLGRDIDGTYAETIVAPRKNMALLPDEIEFEEGAAIALVGVTAWRALIDHGRIESGEKCLIHGGNGGVGHVAVQIAKDRGAEIITTARPEYHKSLKELGADYVFDYKEEKLADLIEQEGTQDVIIDHMCDEYMGMNIQVAGGGARIVGIGQENSDVTIPSFSIARSKEITLHMISMFNTPEICSVLEQLAMMMSNGSLKVVVGDRYSLDEVKSAQTAIYSESRFGKIIIIP